MSERRGRTANAIREVTITPDFLRHPEGSALIRCGDTIVLCTASVEETIKDWLRGQGRGWVTAEYAMLPRANPTRGLREGQFGRWPSGRSQEIQRLIGRALRAVVWPKRIGERQIIVDCDVLSADGGTRTAAITGGFVALVLALERMRRQGKISQKPLKGLVAAVSVGIVDGEVRVDLDYPEDSRADVDLNLAADDLGRLVDVQATAEGRSFDPARLAEMIDYGLEGLRALLEAQRHALATAGVDIEALVERP